MTISAYIYKQHLVAVNDGNASTSLAESTDVLLITVFFNKKPSIYNMFLSENPLTFDSLFDYSSDEENNSLPTGGTQGELGEERGEVSEEELGGGVGTDVSKDGRSKRGQGGGKGGGRG